MKEVYPSAFTEVYCLTGLHLNFYKGCQSNAYDSEWKLTPRETLFNHCLLDTESEQYTVKRGYKLFLF